MRDWLFPIAALIQALPKPPEPPPGQPDGRDVALIAIAIVSTLLVVAWLLKPAALRRLGAGRAPAVEPPAAGEPVIEPEAETPVAEPETKREWATGEELAATSPFETVAETIVESERPAKSGAAAAILDIELERPRPGPSDADLLAAVTMTVRELLGHANAGEYLDGFALYSPSFAARYRAESGLSDDEFAATFAALPAPPPEARAELAAVTGLERLADGRARAEIAYANGDDAPPTERYTFVYSADERRWLIDDIASIAGDV